MKALHRWMLRGLYNLDTKGLPTAVDRLGMPPICAAIVDIACSIVDQTGQRFLCSRALCTVTNMMRVASIRASHYAVAMGIRARLQGSVLAIVPCLITMHACSQSHRDVVAAIDAVVMERAANDAAEATVDVGVTPCSQTSRRCEQSCSPCPASDLSLGFACQADRCVIAECMLGYNVSADGDDCELATSFGPWRLRLDLSVTERPVTNPTDRFATAMALSADGRELVVGQSASADIISYHRDRADEPFQLRGFVALEAVPSRTDTIDLAMNADGLTLATAQRERSVVHIFSRRSTADTWVLAQTIATMTAPSHTISIELSDSGLELYIRDSASQTVRLHSRAAADAPFAEAGERVTRESERSGIRTGSFSTYGDSMVVVGLPQVGLESVQVYRRIPATSRFALEQQLELECLRAKMSRDGLDLFAVEWQASRGMPVTAPGAIRWLHRETRTTPFADDGPMLTRPYRGTNLAAGHLALTADGMQLLLADSSYSGGRGHGYGAVWVYTRER